MKHEPISSLQEFQSKLNKQQNLFLLIYKKGSEQSDCALMNLENMEIESHIPVFSVDVAQVRDVHPAYNISAAPVIIEFKKGKTVRQLKGCHHAGALENFFKPSSVAASGPGKIKQNQVVVYTTPTCSWCRTLKDYLKNNKIQFHEIDVTKDEKAATEMVERSGQQGVPQSLINGQIVVGFDRNKINSLLGING